MFSFMSIAVPFKKEKKQRDGQYNGYNDANDNDSNDNNNDNNNNDNDCMTNFDSIKQILLTVNIMTYTVEKNQK